MYAEIYTTIVSVEENLNDILSSHRQYCLINRELN
uniref:Uncharacterized protein n=1 Tax=Timema monikensis TaxID=170555 RepID=A0A7R9ELS9_9NEOP|nr:unnamed protein product [Timema monikensis]